MVFCASTWSFQKSGAAARDSRRVSSSSRRAASKIAPQIRSAFAEILVTAHQFVDGRHRFIVHGTPLAAAAARKGVVARTPSAPRLPSKTDRQEDVERAPHQHRVTACERGT